MATWRDGPEYAPRQRPLAFVEPTAAPLEVVAEPVPQVAVSAQEPLFSPPSAPTADLASLLPASVPQRDPRQAFEVVSATVAGPGPTAWGAAHSSAPDASTWTPQQPLTASAPPPATAATATPPAPSLPAPPSLPGAGQVPTWYSPPPEGTRFITESQPQSPPNLQAIWRAMTPGVGITLAVGALLGVASVVMLVLAAILSGRIRVAREGVTRAFAVAMGWTALTTVPTLLVQGFDPLALIDAANVWAQLCCWVLLVLVPVIVSIGLKPGRRS